MNETKIPSANELYETILRRSSLPLPGFEKDFHEMAAERALKIHDYLEDRADRLDTPCILCHDNTARRSQTRYVYATPWDEDETEMPFCSEDCEVNYLYTGDFQYFRCDPCGREICEQNPMNGWHIQYRDCDGETVCLKCYKGLILENGVEREKLEDGKIPGMFFEWGNDTAKDAGYAEVPKFTNYFVGSQERADRFLGKALELIDHGYLVVVAYEEMSIDGLEGYVTLMARRGEHGG